MDHRGIRTVCPFCGKRNDTCSPVGGSSGLPDEGSWSLCVRCRKPSVFAVTDNGVLRLRKPNAFEAEPFMKSKTYWQGLREVQAQFGTREEFERRNGGAGAAS